MTSDKETYDFCHWLSDTHGYEGWVRRFDMDNFPIQRELTKEDYVIVLGDFGIWDNSKADNYWLDWLNDKNFTTLFIAGNHDNYDILDNLPKEEWNGGLVNYIRPSVLHLNRGQVFTIDGRTFFTFGGASSHDIQDGILEPDDPNFKEKYRKWNREYKMFRVNHVSWWERELPSREEMYEGIHNLLAHDKKVDYILSHSASSSEQILLGGKGLYDEDNLTQYLEQVKAETDYGQHLFGHMHVNRAINEKDRCLYEDIILLK